MGRHKMCQCGKNRARWGTKEIGRICCVECKSIDMINLDQAKKCGCPQNKTRCFGFPGKSAECCASCKKEGMINVSRLEVTPKNALSFFSRAEFKEDHQLLSKISRKYDFVTIKKDIAASKRLQFLVDVELLFEKFGICVLSAKFYEDNPKFKSIYNQIGNYESSFEKIAKFLHKEEQFENFWKEQRSNNAKIASERQGKKLWTIAMIDLAVKEIILKYNGIPCRTFLEEHNHGDLIAALKRNKISLEDIRKKFDVSGPSRMKDINGKMFRSNCEAAVSNFLLARGIDTKIGQKYDESFHTFTEAARKKAYYDLHFFSIIKSVIINVEIFGGSGNGSGNAKRKTRYEATKTMKINFHADSDNFLAIDWQDCYNDDKLEQILKPFIGIQQLTKTSNFSRYVAPTKWSLLDEVLASARQIYKKMDNKFPPVSWFLRNRNYTNRKILDFERDNWQGFVGNVFTVGGFQLIRRLLGEKQKVKIDWTKDRVLNEFRAAKEAYQMSPYAIQAKLGKNSIKTQIEKDWLSRCDRMIYYAKKFYQNGHLEVCGLVGIKIHCVSRYRTRP